MLMFTSLIYGVTRAGGAALSVVFVLIAAADWRACHRAD